MKKILLLLLSIAIAIVGLAYYFSSVSLLVDNTKPVVSDLVIPRGLSKRKVAFQALIEDREAGIDEVSLDLKQRGYSKSLFRVKLKGQKKYFLETEIDASGSYLVEGKASLVFKVLDASLKGNSFQKLIEIEIDYHKPVITPITQMHNLHRGGIQLVFYEVQERSLYRSGIQAEGLFFPGVPAKLLDFELDSPKLYAAYYTIPEDYVGFPRVFAEDSAGNSSDVRIKNRIIKRRFPEITLTAKKNNDSIVESEFLSARKEGALAISKVIAGKSNENYWKEKFIAPKGIMRSSFGSAVTLLAYADSPVKYREGGYVFNQEVVEVLAAAAGKVLALGEFPFYGKTIVLDHGLGVSSVYAGFDSFSVQHGEQVHQGQLLGKLKKAGYLGENTLLFEMRPHGIPIEAREWWDESWLSEHIFQRIKEVKVNYGR